VCVCLLVCVLYVCEYFNICVVYIVCEYFYNLNPVIFMSYEVLLNVDLCVVTFVLL